MASRLRGRIWPRSACNTSAKRSSRAKYVIVVECQRRDVTVTREEVTREVERMAKRFGLPVEQWYKLLKQERGINPEQYASDIVWPTLALRKLAADKTAITPAELKREFESLYGPAIKARMIVCNTAANAEKLRQQATADPSQFGNLAKDHSQDPATASLKGMIQPIRMHSGDKEIEQAAFGMKDGEISKVVPIAGQFVILQRESEIPARQVTFADSKPYLEELLRDKKLRNVAAEVFQELQKTSHVENILNNPARSREMPGVAALINGNPVTIRELGERCIERHGAKVLDSMINRRLVEQACGKRQIAITDRDLDEEIARAAMAMMPPRKDGSPDVEKWLELITKEQKVTLDVYRHDSVWPKVGLMKLAGDKVEVTEEDLKRGYENNYGPRVRCRVIVLDNLRTAQDVWKRARQEPTVKNFSELASKYSIETSSRALGGEVPPLPRWGGQPLIEKEAFQLKPGEISSVIQLEGDRCVILFCEGMTVPTKIEFKTVRDLIYEDVREKKISINMANLFQKLKDDATIDNYLAGTSQSSKQAAAHEAPLLAQPPATAPRRR
jgi:parvulin-like peptidyl-prolyl isomerase